MNCKCGKQLTMIKPDVLTIDMMKCKECHLRDIIKTKNKQINEFKEWLESSLEFDDKRFHPARRAYKVIFGVELKEAQP